MKDKVNLGIIGVGKWGANLLRNFVNCSEANVSICCDTNPARLEFVHQEYPSIKTTKNIGDIFKDPNIDAVVIAVNTSNHFKIAYEALAARKAIFIEKPMCTSSNEAKILHNKAMIFDLTLMVGHIFLYHPAIIEVKKMIVGGELGEVHTIHSRRLNWGKVRQDENALSSLSPHDISIMLYLFDEMPIEVTAVGVAYLQENIEDMVVASLKFPGNKTGIIHVSWIDPKKERSTTIIGSRWAAIFNDMAKDFKLTLYQEGRKVGCPTFPEIELLALECQHFVDCVKNNRKPLSDGQNGLDVVQVIEATQKALQTHSTVSI